MYIAYSALQAAKQQSAQKQAEPQNNELLLRYQAYQTICNKYQREIATIQEYFPGWTPAFK
jgi:hypothetical protein